MIERIPDQIPVQTGEWHGTTFDIIPKETFGMVCRKINELVDAVNKLHEEAENNARIRANHEKLIDTLVVENNIHEKQIDELQMKLEPEKCETLAENVPPPITLIDIFNEMGRLYADLWNKMEDIHHELRKDNQ